MKQGIPVFLSWAPDSTLPSALLSSEWRGGALQALSKPPASHILLEDEKYLEVKLSNDLMMPPSSAYKSHPFLLSAGSSKGQKPMEKLLAILQYFYKWFSERISIDFLETREQQQDYILPTKPRKVPRMLRYRKMTLVLFSKSPETHFSWYFCFRCDLQTTDI